jgi:hypothetical protein
MFSPQLNFPAVLKPGTLTPIKKGAINFAPLSTTPKVAQPATTDE